MSLKKNHQTTKKALLQTFQKLVTDNGGISVERMNLLSKVLNLPEQQINQSKNIFHFLDNENQLEKVNEALTNETVIENSDFTSVKMANILKANINAFKTLNPEMGVFTFVDILNVFKDKLGTDFPTTISIHTSIILGKHEYCLAVVLDESIQSCGQNICDCLADVLLSYYKRIFQLQK